MSTTTRAEGTYLVRRKDGQVHVAFWQPSTGQWLRLGPAKQAATEVRDEDIEIIEPVETSKTPSWTWSLPDVGEIFWHIEPLSWARRAHNAILETGARLREHALYFFARELAEENDRLRDQLGNVSRELASVSKQASVAAARDAAVEQLVFALHIYPNHRLANRGPTGCIMKAIKKLAPDVAKEIVETSASAVYGERWADDECTHHTESRAEPEPDQCKHGNVRGACQDDECPYHVGP